MIHVALFAARIVAPARRAAPFVASWRTSYSAREHSTATMRRMKQLQHTALILVIVVATFTLAFVLGGGAR